MTVIRSRDNPRVKRWAKLLQDSSTRRREASLVIEGPHLLSEALAAGIELRALMVSESGLQQREIADLVRGREPVVLGDGLFRNMSDADTPVGVAAEIGIPQTSPDGEKPVVFLEGVQDPGNVGAILRSAAAFGIGEVVLDRACADVWSPKVLRAGMGAHFKLALHSTPDLGRALEVFRGTTLCTVATKGEDLRQASLPGRLGWIFGAEGKGVSAATADRARRRIAIPMAPGSESLNVAAAAAICLYEGFCRAVE